MPYLQEIQEFYGYMFAVVKSDDIVVLKSETSVVVISKNNPKYEKALASFLTEGFRVVED